MDYAQYMALPFNEQLVIANLQSLSDSDLEEVFKTAQDIEVVHRASDVIDSRAKRKTQKTYRDTPYKPIKVKPAIFEVSITCPRCGYIGGKSTYASAQSHILGCFLLCLALVPGIFYYVLVGNRIVCPRCAARF